MKHPNGLLIIRHAQTDMAGSFCGHSDPRVNGKGQEQICKLLKRLENEHIDAVYTSDLRRAVMTGEMIAARFTAPLAQHRGLREMNFGDWEALTWQEIEVRKPSFAEQWIDNFPNLSTPNGERFETFEERIIAAICNLKPMANNQRIAIVTHAGAMRTILTRLCGVDTKSSWDMTKAYCSFFSYPFKTLPSEDRMRT